MNTVINL